jgi:hypothetical protein
MHHIVSGFNLGEGHTILGVYTSKLSAVIRMETVEKFDEDEPGRARFRYFHIQSWKGDTMVKESVFSFKKGILTPSK